MHAAHDLYSHHRALHWHVEELRPALCKRAREGIVGKWHSSRPHPVADGGEQAEGEFCDLDLALNRPGPLSAKSHVPHSLRWRAALRTRRMAS